MKTFLGLTTMLAVAGSATAAPVTGWVQIFDGQTASTGITDAGTNSPTLGDADAASMAANFASVTLADGESITVTGSVAIDTDLVGGQLRVGLYEGDNPVVAGDSNGYVGFYSAAPVPTGTSGGVWFADDSGETGVHPFDGAISTGLGALPNTAVGVPANQAIDYVLTITRDDAGGGLDIFASYDSGAYSTSLLIDDHPSTQYTFDTVAFLIGGAQNGTSAAFSDIDVTVVPEPGSLALLGLGTLALLRRRRA